ncbi:hypothetical protein NL676_022716 [Syzygium grande]|nr:hypothetical protein NL676_022716 [Syzygium grande]
MPDLANNSNPSLSSPLAVAPGGGGGSAGAGLKSAPRALAGVVPDREPARERNPHPQNGGAALRRHAARTLGDYVGNWAARKAGSGEAQSRCFLPCSVRLPSPSPPRSRPSSRPGPSPDSTDALRIREFMLCPVTT